MVVEADQAQLGIAQREAHRGVDRTICRADIDFTAPAASPRGPAADGAILLDQTAGPVVCFTISPALA